jgi:DNA adenine methylase
MKLPLKWHGGKFYLAKDIVSLMPEHIHYVEPYFGGGAVLFAKDPQGVSEVVNDLNKFLTTFWTVMRCPLRFKEFYREIEAAPFSEALYQSAVEVLDNNSDQIFSSEVDLAVAFFVACRQSLAGRMKSFTGVTKTRTRRGMNNEVSAWLSSIEGLPAAHARLKRVLVLNRSAIEVIRGQDGSNVLMYIDPPYMPSTRVSTEVYEHEMTREQHVELLDTLADPALKSRWMLSGYRSDLYDEYASKHKWNRHDFLIANHASGKAEKAKVTENLWCNF